MSHSRLARNIARSTPTVFGRMMSVSTRRARRGLGVFGEERQRELEHSAAAVAMAGSNRAVVCFDDRSDDGQAHAHTVLLRRVKGFEHRLFGARGDSRTGVADG